jgi:hypothetical protein
MSAPIPIKKEENTGGYFASWFKKQKDKENIEEEIFEMSDDELPPKLKPNPPKEEDLDDVDDSEQECTQKIPEQWQEDYCFGFPCTNKKYFGFCKKCEEDSICSLIVESVQQGFYDMREDIQCLWQRDVVKVWTVFLTVCYFNIPTEAMFAGAFYYMNKKFEDHEKKITSQSTLPPVTDSETDEDEEQDEETKKCV